MSQVLMLRAIGANSQALLIDNLPVVIGNSDLEYTLGQINRNGSSMHFGLLSSKTDPHPHEHRHRLLGDEKTGESIPSYTCDGCMKDHIFLLSTATGVAVSAWAFWHFTGLSGLNILSTVALVAITGDNIRLRRLLRAKQ